MNRNYKITTALALILFGVLSLLGYFSIISVSESFTAAAALIIYSLPAVYFSLNEKNRIRLLTASILFMIGIIFLIKENFELINSRGLIFTSILFIGGSTFMILFIEDTKQKIFLYASAVLMTAGYLSVTLFRNLGIINFANRLADTAEDFWPVVLILWGLNIFWNRKRG
ncbi:MAG: hypothetical protein HYS25_14600 [Ignavibacteriales bacterium]|nr:hypothetical protein [Ignavibacteriales bacterium]